MKDRLKILRKHLNLKQGEFAKRLGINQGTFSTYETGAVEVRDSVVKAICSVYNVNERWLRTGEGEIFIDSNDLNSFMSTFSQLSKENQEYLNAIADTMLKKQDTQDN